VIEDLILGIGGIALGAGLILGHRYIQRQMWEAQKEHMKKPLLGAMWEASQRQSPRWMRGERYPRYLTRVWLLGAGCAFVYYGVKLVLRAV
jgi:hypothetical protein